VRFFLPDGLDFARLLQTIEGRVERPLFEVQQSVAGLVQPVKNFQPVRLAPFQDGEDQRFQVAAELVAMNRFHAVIIDSLGISVKRSAGRVFRRLGAVK
jgi:hypothetical protein